MLVRECMLYSRAVKRIRFDHVFRKSFLIRLAVSSHACACAFASQLCISALCRTCGVYYTLCLLIIRPTTAAATPPHWCDDDNVTEHRYNVFSSVRLPVGRMCELLLSSIHTHIHIYMDMFIFWRSGQPIAAAAAAAKRTAEERLCEEFLCKRPPRICENTRNRQQQHSRCMPLHLLLVSGVQHNLFAQHLLNILGSISDGVWRLYTLSNNLSHSLSL